MKRCPHCGETKPLSDFYTKKDGSPQSWCKPCHYESTRSYYERNREARNARIVAGHRARLLGLTTDEYLALPEDPGSHCSICGALPSSKRNGRFRSNGSSARPKRLSVDHCHQTGAIRGFLCSSCNHAIGQADDDPALLRLMADYIESARISGPAWVVRPVQPSGRRRQEECMHGHPLSGDNLYVSPLGVRRCRACAARRYRENKRVT